MRRAEIADAEACAAIVDDWIAATPWMPRGIDRDGLVAVMARMFPQREVWVAGDPLAGYLSMDAEIAHVWGLYVAEPGRGLGKALLDRAKDGRDRLALNTHLPNLRAQAFYAREGFVAVGAPWRGEDGVDEIRMEWRR